MTIALYWPATGFDFINYDDQEYVTANRHVQAGLNWEGVKWAFLSRVCANWHPVTVLSHMLDCQMAGLRPGRHHLTNVLFHALNAALVFMLLHQMTGAKWRSLFVAALFAVHPLRVESVAWVAERKDVLSGFFGLLALWAYARYAQKECRMQNAECRMQNDSSLQPPAFYFLSLFFFALGLMSKPMLVTWPFVMLLLDYWPLERFKSGRPWRLMREKIPFVALAAAMSVVTLMVQKRADAMTGAEALSLGARTGNALVSYWRYLGKLFWPTDLAVFYPHPEYWPLAKVLLAGAGMLGISLLLLWRRRCPFLLMGWLWFIGTLVPVIGLVQVGGQAMADRYTYLPSLGVMMLSIWGAYDLAKRWRCGVIAASVAGSAAIVLCLGLTRHQLGYWRDGEALFRHALAVTADNYLAHNSLGTALDKRGYLDEAINHYQEAIRLRPAYAEAHNNLGYSLGRKGQWDVAISQHQEAIRLKPRCVQAHNNLGLALVKKGQLDEAISQFREAIRLKSDYAEAHNNLGIALGRKSQISEAISHYQEAIRLEPDNADAHYNLGITLGRKGQLDDAIRQFQQAIRLRPDSAEGHINLGVALGMRGRIDEAIGHLQEALRLKPDSAEARTQLVRVLEIKKTRAGR